MAFVNTFKTTLYNIQNRKIYKLYLNIVYWDMSGIHLFIRFRNSWTNCYARHDLS